MNDFVRSEARKCLYKGKILLSPDERPCGPDNTHLKGLQEISHTE